MVMETYADIYINFILSSFGKIEMTKLSTILDGKYSHDVFTKNLLLNDEIETDKDLWKRVKPILREYENKDDGCLIIDDSLLAKPYTKVSDMVCWHYDHTIGKSRRGILMLNFQYTDASGISLPIGYEIITKTEDVYDKKKKKWVKKSKFTKNEIMRDKLEINWRYYTFTIN